MIEWLNETFGLDNTVTIPTIISILVFLIGGVASYIFVRANEYQKRRRLRKSFNLLVQEVIKDLVKKERNAFRFYPQLTPEHTSSWFLPHKAISYLETFFELDFNEVFYAYRKKIFWQCSSRRVKEKSFHRIWGILRDLKFLEQNLEKHVDGLTSRFGTYHKTYGEKLDEYRKYNDNLMSQTQGVPVSDLGEGESEYLKEIDRTWYAWQQIEESERSFYNVTYKELVQPILEINKQFPILKMAQESNNLLLECVHQYIEIENTLKVYKRTFKNYYWSYRHAHRLLVKSLEILE